MIEPSTDIIQTLQNDFRSLTPDLERQLASFYKNQHFKSTNHEGRQTARLMLRSLRLASEANAREKYFLELNHQAAISGNSYDSDDNEAVCKNYINSFELAIPNTSAPLSKDFQQKVNNFITPLSLTEQTNLTRNLTLYLFSECFYNAINAQLTEVAAGRLRAKVALNPDTLLSAAKTRYKNEMFVDAIIFHEVLSLIEHRAFVCYLESKLPADDISGDKRHFQAEQNWMQHTLSNLDITRVNLFATQQLLSALEAKENLSLQEFNTIYDNFIAAHHKELVDLSGPLLGKKPAEQHEEVPFTYESHDVSFRVESVAAFFEAEDDRGPSAFRLSMRERLQGEIKDLDETLAALNELRLPENLQSQLNHDSSALALVESLETERQTGRFDIQHLRHKLASHRDYLQNQVGTYSSPIDDEALKIKLNLVDLMISTVKRVGQLDEQTNNLLLEIHKALADPRLNNNSADNEKTFLSSVRNIIEPNTLSRLAASFSGFFGSRRAAQANPSAIASTPAREAVFRH